MSEAYRVIVSKIVTAQLDQIYAYIAADSEQNAARMLERLLIAIDDLAFMPRRFRVSGYSLKHDVEIHSRVVDPYLVYYYVDEIHRQVVITEVRHGARLQPPDFD